MSPANIAPNQPMMRDILPHLALQLRLDLQVLQPIFRNACLLAPRQLWCSGRGLWRDERGGREGERRERRNGGGGGEEGREGGYLRGCEVAYFGTVVDLKPGADARGSVVPDPVESR